MCFRPDPPLSRPEPSRSIRQIHNRQIIKRNRDEFAASALDLRLRYEHVCRAAMMEDDKTIIRAKNESCFAFHTVLFRKKLYES
jgi:hypothetical protein